MRIHRRSAPGPGPCRRSGLKLPPPGRFKQPQRQRRPFVIASARRQIAGCAKRYSTTGALPLPSAGLLRPASDWGGKARTSSRGIVTTSAPAAKNRVCLYCGLPSGATNHGTVGECVDAIQCETVRLRDELRHSKPGVPVASRRPADRDDARATWPRLTRVG